MAEDAGSASSRRLIQAVNDQVSLAMLLSRFGYDSYDPDISRSVKIHCPFGWQHNDMGRSKAFRIYDTNTAYCFAGCGYFNPVRLAATEWGMTEREAAGALAQNYQVKTGDLDAAISLLKQDLQPDRASLVKALQLFVEREGLDSVEARQALGRCAGLVDYVRNPVDATVWMEKSKRIVRAHHNRGADQ